MWIRVCDLNAGFQPVCNIISGLTLVVLRPQCLSHHCNTLQTTTTTNKSVMLHNFKFYNLVQVPDFALPAACIVDTIITTLGLSSSR